MIGIFSNSTDPYFNLSLEEHLFKNRSDEVFLLWRSVPAVVVGKHQNTYAEVDLSFVHKNNIQIARRLSGGGTVVHDFGNINFTFIRNGQEGKLIDFEWHVRPIMDFLKTIGLDVKMGAKNELLAGDYKISGNAEHIYKRRILHHGTLLFDSDLDQLKRAIKQSRKKYYDRSVQSNRSEVINIKQLLNVRIERDEFENRLYNYICTNFNAKPYQLQPEVIEMINKQVQEKYKQKTWIYSYFSKYSFKNRANISKYIFDIELVVEKGKVVKCKIDNKAESANEFDLLQQRLTGAYHLFEEFRDIISDNIHEDKTLIDRLTYCFF